MRTLYLECNMGAAGDMLMAALLELHPDPKDFLQRFEQLSIPGVHLQAEPSVKCGITGTHVTVTVHGEEEHEGMWEHGHENDHEHGHDHKHDHSHGHDHSYGHDHSHEHHHHTGMGEIAHLVSHLNVSPQVREDIQAVYVQIARAESHAHGKPVDQIHFHEVGTMDAVADIAGVCLLIRELAPDRILASPVHVGSGQVRCAHGILPVPAPATAHILEGVPVYGGEVKGELCTPTGAALLKHFVSEFGSMPVMKIQKTGYGMGNKDFAQANCVRAMIGETEVRQDGVLELRCNLDDMTAEAVGFAQEQLLEAGALDVYTIAIGMKKGRPGTMLTCMCREADREKMLSLLFLHTTTLGIREYSCARHTLERNVYTKETAYGPVQIKESSGFGVCRKKAEYEDLARIARTQRISLEQVKSVLRLQE